MVIKTVSRRNWPEGADHGYATWYEPQSEPAKIRAAVSWALPRRGHRAGDPRRRPAARARRRGRAGPDAAPARPRRS